MTKDHYKTLGIDKTATRDEVRKAYFKLVMKYHPDRHPLKRATYEQRMKVINEAYTNIARQRRWKTALRGQVKTMSNDNSAAKRPSWYAEILNLFKTKTIGTERKQYGSRNVRF